MNGCHRTGQIAFYRLEFFVITFIFINLRRVIRRYTNIQMFHYKLSLLKQNIREKF